MRLKRLEIIGFKSFPEKSVIDFPAGISAIVGPNGCGKSNIIDAIKWVMGEQSIKQLRGKSMGDVIFAGTEKRAPLNMAEVSLVLENDTPETMEPDFSQLTEIMITRRLFRSGESAYFLNKQPCRLKDILNIFLGSGMGAKSCAIVQQGNIGAITDATPEERRSFIEEAAGVTRYKTRKAEAMAKVNSTHQNLLRLNDIIEEIRKQMNTLRRQARKAQTYKVFREGLKTSEILVSVHYHEQFTAQIVSTQTLLAELKQADHLNAGELAKLNAALEKIKTDRAAKDSLLSRKKAEKTEAEKTLDQLKNDLKYLRSEEKRLSAEIIGLEAATRDLSAKNRKISDEIAEETIKRKTLGREIESVKTELAGKTAAAQTVRARMKETQESLESLKKDLMQVISQKMRVQNIFKHAESSRENLGQRIRRIQAEETEVAEKTIRLQHHLREAETIRKEILDQKESLITRISEKKEMLTERSSDLGKQIKSVMALAGERNRVRSEYNALKKMEEAHAWYRDGVKAVMQHFKAEEENPRSSENQSRIGIAADGLEPAPGYELALEAALGEVLQYILLREPGDGVAAIHYLKETDTGRCGFIPESAFEGPSASPPLPPGDARLLISHVTVKEGFDARLISLVQGVAVAETLEEALAACNSGVEFSRIVTKSGDIVFPNGMMVGGSQEKLSGIYKKKLALKELHQRLGRLESDLDSAQQKQSALETEVKSLEADLQKLTVQKNHVETEFLEAEKKHFQASEGLKHAQAQHELVCLEREKLMGEKTDIEAEISAHDAALAKITAREQELEGDISRISASIEEYSLEIREFQDSEMESKLSLTKLTAELQHTEKTLKRLLEFQAEGAAQAEQIQTDIAVKTRKIAETAARIAEMEAGLSETEKELHHLSLALQDYDADFRRILTEIAETDETITQTRTRLEETRQKIHQLELSLSGFTIQRENVINRFLDRYSESFADVLAAHRATVQSPDFSIEKTEAALAAYRKKMERIGDVNLGAIEAYEEQKTRYEFLIQQRDDLTAAIADLERVIRKINRITQQLFMEMFDKINDQFKAMFPRLFAGGSAWMELTQPNSPLETGVELMIHPPGKKVTRLSLLSGGEKALSAIAFIFSTFLINPASYCLLDEIDAPLDEANTNRFNELLRMIGEKSQIIMISHNKRSMEFADMLFGVTMAESGVSKLVSVNIEKLIKQSTETTPSHQN